MHDAVERFADVQHLFLKEAKVLHAALDRRGVLLERLGADAERSVACRDLEDGAPRPARRGRDSDPSRDADTRAPKSPSVDSETCDRCDMMSSFDSFSSLRGRRAMDRCLLSLRVGCLDVCK